MDHLLKNLRTNGVFITGTDTGVGKTIVAALMLRDLRVSGIAATYFKPVQTGCRRRGKELIAPDLATVCALAGIRPSKKEKQLMAPCRYIKACSPHLAARIEERPIVPCKIINSFKILKNRHDFMIVEGAGGILTPLSRKYSMLDLMKALALPVILVARPGLGTINHTLLTLRELRRAKLNVIGIVINYTDATRKTVIEKDNLKTVERLGNTRIIAELPFMRDLQTNVAPGLCFTAPADV